MNDYSKVEAAQSSGGDNGLMPRIRRLPRWQRGSLALAPLALAAAAFGIANREAPPPAAPPAPVVTVAAPLVRQLDEWDDYIGRFDASRAVEVRPRVSGAVTGVHFADGSYVRKGQLLFTIDQRPFAASLAEARAGLASAQSELALARTDLGRGTRLLESDAIAQADVDQLRARVRSAEASVAAAQARVRTRALDLEFTSVRAPISGRISDRRVDAGNLVAAGEAAGSTLLTTINALDPIYFTFEGSEGLFLKMKRSAQGGAKAPIVEIRLQDEGEYRWKGRLDFTDNALDTRSGTIRGRAILDNPGMFLTPGMFGDMRLSTGSIVNAMLVPDAAIQTDQARKLVLVVGRDGTVTGKPVELGPVVDGLRVIRSGLAPSDRVVISGTQMAMPGTKVQVQPGRIEPPATQSAAVGRAANGEATLAR